MPALYLAILVLAAVTGVNSLIAGDGADWSMMEGLETALGIMFVALFVVDLILVILRFRDNFLKDEGYLMFTLPVTEWELTASKAIAGFCSILLTAAVGMLALFVYGFIADFQDMLYQLSRLPRFWNEHIDRVGSVQAVIEVVGVLVFVFQQLCLIYASMTVSQIAPRFRGLAGFGVYLAVMIVAGRLSWYFVDITFFPSLWDLGLFLLLISIFAALCFWSTGWLLKRTLNLE
jgi:hypothetical protein